MSLQRDNFVSIISVMDYAMSDHYCVECTLNVSIKPGKAQFEQRRAVNHIQNEKNANWRT